MLENVVCMLLALSVASERLVDIVKHFVPYLDVQKNDPAAESIRKGIIQILAVVAGIVTTILAHKSGSLPLEILPSALNTPFGLIIVGLLASGGSGFWNLIVTYLQKVKDLKKIELNNAKK